MLTKSNTAVFVSLPDMRIKFEEVSNSLNILVSKKNVYAMSMHSMHKTFDFTRILRLIEKKFTGSAISIIVETPIGVCYSLLVSPDQRILTKVRGYVRGESINQLDVIIDYEGNVCKLIEKTNIDLVDEPMFVMETEYNNNFVANGIILKGFEGPHNA